jgi:hypothetical protein
MNRHWAYGLIGLPWSPEFNCWALMRHTFRERLQIELPEEAAGVLILTGAAHTTGLRPHAGLGQADDLVLMRMLDGRRHVGMLIHANGKLGVLHNDGHMTEGGPVGCVGFSTLRELAQHGFGDFQFWRRQ